MNKKYILGVIDAVKKVQSTQSTNIGDELDDEDIDDLIAEEYEAIADYEEALKITTCPHAKEQLTHIMNEEIEHVKELEDLKTKKEAAQAQTEDAPSGFLYPRLRKLGYNDKDIAAMSPEEASEKLKQGEEESGEKSSKKEEGSAGGEGSKKGSEEASKKEVSKEEQKENKSEGSVKQSYHQVTKKHKDYLDMLSKENDVKLSLEDEHGKTPQNIKEGHWYEITKTDREGHSESAWYKASSNPDNSIIDLSTTSSKMMNIKEWLKSPLRKPYEGKLAKGVKLAGFNHHTGEYSDVIEIIGQNNDGEYIVNVTTNGGKGITYEHERWSEERLRRLSKE